MSKTTQQPVRISDIMPLSVTEQTHILGGMATTEEEKRKKVK
jgi:hypothetical protein